MAHPCMLDHVGDQERERWKLVPGPLLHQHHLQLIHRTVLGPSPPAHQDYNLRRASPRIRLELLHLSGRSHYAALRLILRMSEVLTGLAKFKDNIAWKHRHVSGVERGDGQ